MSTIFFSLRGKKEKRGKRDSNLGGFGNAELGLCQANVSRDVKVHRGGRSGEVARRSSHQEALRLPLLLLHTLQPLRRPRPALEDFDPRL